MITAIRLIFFAIIQGIKNLFKNKIMTLASIVTIAASLFVVGLFYCVVTNVEYMMSEFQNNIGITVFFEEGTTENEILTLKNQLEVRDEVYNVSYISAEQAWNGFKNDYFEGREELLEGFEEDNPLKGSASLEIEFADITKQQELVDILNKQDIVRIVNDSTEVGSIFTNINKLVSAVSLSIILILAIISLFIIANTIRMAITLRKREINIMRYIGARNSMIRGPFVIEGLIIGVIGSIIPLLIINFTYGSVINDIMVNFFLLRDILAFVPVKELIWKLTPLLVIAGGSLGLLGSGLTVGRYIKV